MFVRQKLCNPVSGIEDVDQPALFGFFRVHHGFDVTNEGCETELGGELGEHLGVEWWLPTYES